MIPKNCFQLEWHTYRKVLHIRYQGFIDPRGWLYWSENIDESVKGMVGYNPHAIVLKLIPREIITLCSLMERAEPAITYLSHKFPDLKLISFECLF